MGCIDLSGLDTTEFFSRLKNIYTQLNERIVSFADFLVINVADQYELIAEAIANHFNSEVGGQLASLLGVTVSVSYTPPVLGGKYHGPEYGLNPVEPGRPPVASEIKEMNSEMITPVKAPATNHPIPDAEITPVKTITPVAPSVMTDTPNVSLASVDSGLSGIGEAVTNPGFTTPSRDFSRRMM